MWNCLFWINFLLQYAVILVDSLQCLKCDHVISPLLCTGKTTCDATEVCFIEKYKGSDEEIYFNLGCKLRNKCGLQGGVDICNNCCESELCNYNGCGQTALVDNHGPICLSCSQTRDPSRCDTIQLCEQGEQCHIEETNQFGIHFYKTGCMSEHNCRHFLSPTDIFGRRSISKRSSVTCAQCCKGTLCNNQCTQGIMSTEATSSVLTTTPSVHVPTIPRITTKPTTQTTTPIPNGDHKGTEFYLMFILDWSGSEYIQLIITAENRASVIITSPFGLNQSVTVTGGFKVVNIASTIDHIVSNMKYDRGIHITSDNPISIAGVSYHDCCAALGFNVLPSRYLGIEYNVASIHQTKDYGQSFGLVSTADNNYILLHSKTNVSIRILGSQLSSVKNASLQLNRLQSYFFEGTFENDVSGIRITSTKPIVLFSGNSHLNVESEDADSASENTLPIKYWGQTFVVPIIPSSRITLNYAICKPNTRVNVTGRGYSTTNLASSAMTVHLDEGSYTVSASHPILVTLYTNRTNSSINPFMSTVPATTQYSNNYVVGTPTFHTQGDKLSYMAIMIKEIDYGGLQLNGKPLYPLQGQSISLNGEMYKTVAVKIDNNVANRLTHSNPNVVYGAIVYGYAYNIAYGYPAGFRL